jgi:hypothetical protein
MHEYIIANVLDELYPRLGEEHGDWEEVAADATSGRSRRRLILMPGPRRVALAFATAAVLAALAVVPALAVSKDWWGLGPGALKPTSPMVFVGNPKIGDSWALIAYMSNAEICYSAAPLGEPGGTFAGVCGTGALGESNLPASGATFGMTRRFAFGPATLDIATVDVELGDGRIVSAEMATHLEKLLGIPLQLYIAKLPVNATVTRIVGKDSEGRVIGVISIPSGLVPETGSS